MRKRGLMKLAIFAPPPALTLPALINVAVARHVQVDGDRGEPVTLRVLETISINKHTFIGAFCRSIAGRDAAILRCHHF